MPLAYFWSYLTKNATYSVARGVSFDSNIVFRVEMLEDKGLSKHLLQLGKGSSNIES